jgi:hypothetical protein
MMENELKGKNVEFEVKPWLDNLFYENLTRIPRPVDGDEWFVFTASCELPHIKCYPRR